MRRDHFEKLQAADAPHFLGGLLAECRQRLLDAARLVAVESEEVTAVRERWHEGQVNHWPLLLAYTFIAERYVERYFNSQESLFPTPGQAEDAKRSRYLHWRVKPRLLDDPVFVRLALQSSGLLPSGRDPQANGALLLEHARDMSMPEPDPQAAFLEFKL